VTRVEKTPAFPFYGKDAYDDEAFFRLSFGSQGFYFFLAWWQWQEGSIPADLEVILDKVPRRKVTEARNLWPKVESMFPIIDDRPDRRQDPAVERRRNEVLDKRARHQTGAYKTIAKRFGMESLFESPSDASSDSLRAEGAGASADATANKTVTLVADLAKRGLKMHGRKAEVVLNWPEKYGADVVLAAFDANAESILVADHPVQYLAAILRNGGSRGHANRNAGGGGAAAERPAKQRNKFHQRSAADVLAAKRKV
jgi:hypothetical protein